MGPKPKKVKARRKHGKLRYIFLLVGIPVLFFVINGTLFVLGLAGISFAPAQSAGGNIRVTLNVPNQSFIPIDGRVVTHLYDPITRQLLGSGDNKFHLAPSAVGQVLITMPYTSGPADHVRVVMDYYIGAYGVVIPYPIRAADVTITPPP